MKYFSDTSVILCTEFSIPWLRKAIAKIDAITTPIVSMRNMQIGTFHYKIPQSPISRTERRHIDLTTKRNGTRYVKIQAVGALAFPPVVILIIRKIKEIN